MTGLRKVCELARARARVRAYRVIAGMFDQASAFNQDIGGWNVDKVTSMVLMFEGATAFDQDLSGWCVSNITSAPDYFDTVATSWVLDRPGWGTCPS